MFDLAEPRFMSLEGFLEWEREQPERHEFVDGQVFRIGDAPLVHNDISACRACRDMSFGTCLLFEERGRGFGGW